MSIHPSHRESDYRSSAHVENLESRFLLAAGPTSTLNINLDDAGTGMGNFVVTDAAGNAIVARTVNPQHSADTLDIHIAKYTPQGTRLWQRSIGGAGRDIVADLAIDSTGIVLTGSFTGVVDFDPCRPKHLLNGGGGFVLRLDRDGKFVWARRVNTGRTKVSAVAMQNGQVYLAGRNKSGGYLSKFAANGEVLWTAQPSRIDGFDYSPDTCGFDDIAVDPKGNVFAVGSFTGKIDFDPSDKRYELAFGGYLAMCIWKLTSAGQFAFAKVAATGLVWPASIAIDAAGRIHIAGQYRDHVVFAGPTRQYAFDCFTSGGNSYEGGNYDSGNMFLARYAATGSLIWARSVGTPEYDWGSGIATSGNDIYVFGYVNGGSRTFMRYDSGGRQLWMQQDLAGVNFDVSGSIAYVVGSSVLTRYKFGAA